MIDSMRECDLNHDQEISFDEFIRWFIPWNHQTASPCPSLKGCVFVEYLWWLQPEVQPLQGYSACAKRAAYPDPKPRSLTPRIPRCPSGLTYTEALRLGSELFPGLGILTGPTTGSNIVNRGTSLGQQLNRIILADSWMYSLKASAE